MLEFLHGAPYAVCVELKNLYPFVFCFGCLLFVSCVAVCGCGDVKSWDGCCWGVGVCMMGICGERRTCRLYSVKSVGSECGGRRRGYGGLGGGLDICGCYRW